MAWAGGLAERTTSARNRSAVRKPAAIARYLASTIGLSRSRLTTTKQPEPGLRIERCPELDCLRGILPATILHEAEKRSHAIGVGADQVLIRRGVITERAYLERLARHTRRRTGRLRQDCPRRLPAFRRPTRLRRTTRPSARADW